MLRLRLSRTCVIIATLLFVTSTQLASAWSWLIHCRLVAQRCLRSREFSMELHNRESRSYKCIRIGSECSPSSPLSGLEDMSRGTIVVSDESWVTCVSRGLLNSDISDIMRAGTADDGDPSGYARTRIRYKYMKPHIYNMYIRYIYIYIQRRHHVVLSIWRSNYTLRLLITRRNRKNYWYSSCKSANFSKDLLTVELYQRHTWIPSRTSSRYGHSRASRDSYQSLSRYKHKKVVIMWERFGKKWVFWKCFFRLVAIIIIQLSRTIDLFFHEIHYLPSTIL